MSKQDFSWILARISLSRNDIFGQKKDPKVPSWSALNASISSFDDISTPISSPSDASNFVFSNKARDGVQFTMQVNSKHFFVDSIACCRCADQANSTKREYGVMVMSSVT